MAVTRGTADTLDTVLTQASDVLAGLVARVAPALVAVRIASNRYQPGLLLQQDGVVTAEAGLSPQEACSLVRPGGDVVSGLVARRDAGSGIAVIGLAASSTPPALTLAGPARPGALAVLLGVTAAADPTARLVTVYAAAADAGSAARLILDTGLPPDAAGGPVLDAAGHLLGLAVAGPDGLARVMPHACLTALFDGVAAAPAPPARGWLGLALQPVAMRTGFGWLGGAKGRRVTAVEPRSPGARGGIAVGDTLLAVDGRPISGQHSLREFLAADRVGQTIELRLERNGKIETHRLTVAPHPDG